MALGMHTGADARIPYFFITAQGLHQLACIPGSATSIAKIYEAMGRGCCEETKGLSDRWKMENC